jgi:hypothetical protein
MEEKLDLAQAFGIYSSNVEYVGNEQQDDRPLKEGRYE